MTTPRTRTLLLVSLLLGLGPALLRGGDASAADWTIVDDASGAPVAGASVELEPRTPGAAAHRLASGAGGRVEIPASVEGSYVLRVRAKGYAPAWHGPVRLSSQIRSLAGGTVRLKRSGEIRVEVVDESGAPLANLSCSVSGSEWRSGTTGARGELAFADLPPGSYRVQAQGKGFLRAIPVDAVVEPGSRATVKVALDHGSAISGKVVTADGTPIHRASIATDGSSDYAYDASERDGSFRLAPLGRGSHTLRLSGEGLDSRVVKGVAAGTTSLTVVMEPLPPQFQLFADKQVFRPGEPVTMDLRALRCASVDLDVYRLPDASLVDAAGRFVAPRGRPAGAPVQTISHPLRYGRRFSFTHEEVALPVAEPGAYVVVGRAGRIEQELAFVVSDLGLVVKRAPGEILAWAVHLGSGAPFEGAEVSIASADARLAAGTTDAKGLYRTALPASVAATVTARSGPHVASVGAPLAPGALGRLQAYVYTDRPVYRPGQQVFWKAIVRRVTEEGHAVPASEEVTVRVRDVEGQAIAESTLRLSAMGTTSGNLELGAEPPLGAYAIELSLGDETASGSFKVFEYRKPELKVDVTADRPQVVFGETVTMRVSAAYHFGAPVAGATASYAIYATPFEPEAMEYEWGGESYDAGYGQLVASDTTTLGPDGTAVVAFTAPVMTRDMRLAAEVVVTDASNRSATGRTSLVAARGAFRLSARTSSYVLSPGSSATIVVEATTFDGAPAAAGVEVEVTRRSWSSTGRRWDESTLLRQGAATAADGTARVPTPPLPEGYYAVRASARDDGGHVIEARAWFWCADGDFDGVAEDLASLQAVPDRTSYAPGETARIIVSGLPPDASLLVTRERDRIASADVISARGSFALVELPVTEGDAPNLYLAVSTVRDGRHLVRAIPVVVESRRRALALAIRPDRERYRPGDEAVVEVEVRDGDGRPVPGAELSLGVVDEAIYGISEELAPDIVKFFHGLRPNRVATVYSFATRQLGGADKDRRARVRRNFKDTAFWAPALRTDGDGRATVRFPWPDNLTTWRFTARAVTDETAVGAAVARALVSQDLVSRIHAPRFLVGGDAVSVDVVVNDLAGKERELSVSLEASGARIVGPGTQEGYLAPRGEGRFRFTVEATAPGALMLRSAVVDRAGSSTRPEDDRDAMEIGLPIHAFGRPFSAVANGELSGRATDDVLLDVPAGAIPESLTATLQVNPSVASAAFGALDDLVGYPYGCSEQTMSRFLPTVIASQAARTMGASLGARTGEVPAMVEKGTRKLYGYQHADGGWGWWEDDATDPYMTAYVTWGLVLARDAGFPVEAERIERGLSSTSAQLAAAKAPDVKAFMLHALAAAGRVDRGAAVALFAERAKLSAYGKGLLLTSLRAAGEGERGALLVGELEARASLGGGSAAGPYSSGPAIAHWDAETWNEGWMRNPVEATAYALRGIVATDPTGTLATRAARWLVLNRKGSSWHSTKDSAAAVYALLDFTKAREPVPDARIDVRLDGASVGDLAFRGFDGLAGRPPMSLPASALPAGSHRLSLSRTGNGNVFYAARVTGVVAQERVAPEGGVLRVSREYRLAERMVSVAGASDVATRPLQGPLSEGSLVEVRLTVTASEEMDFVMLEDPLPAGFEVEAEPAPTACEECDESDLPYDRREVWDEKVAFFRTRLPKGRWEVTYLAKAESVGRMRVLPPRVEAVYVPGTAGHGASDEMEVIAR